MDTQLTDQGLEEVQSEETQELAPEEQEEYQLPDWIEDQDFDFGEQSSEEEVTTFMSEDEVPEELKPQWREMNKKFTKTQQELARLRRELEEALNSVRSAQPQQAPQSTQGLNTGNPVVDNDPVLGWLTQQYQEAIQDGDVTTAQRIGAEFQNRLQLLTVQSEIDRMKNELLSAKLDPQLQAIRNNPFFAEVWSKDAEAKIRERVIKYGDSPTEAAWAVLGQKAAAKAALKAYNEARNKKVASEKASTPAGTPSTPAAQISDLPAEAIMHGDRPSIAKIWQKVKELGRR